jgi:hypothetical protein
MALSSGVPITDREGVLVGIPRTETSASRTTSSSRSGAYDVAHLVTPGGRRSEAEEILHRNKSKLPVVDATGGCAA